MLASKKKGIHEDANQSISKTFYHIGEEIAKSMEDGLKMAEMQIERRKGKMLHTHEIIKAVEAEFKRIDIPEKKFHSDHEAWAVLLEEVEELDLEADIIIKHKVERLKEQIFSGLDSASELTELDDIYEHAVLAAAEAVQVAAVATKFIKLKEKRVAGNADKD